MTTFTSFNPECICLETPGCEVMSCGHAFHPECVKTLTNCPLCQREIHFILPSVQRTRLVSKQQVQVAEHEVNQPQIQINEDGEIMWAALSGNAAILRWLHE